MGVCTVTTITIAVLSIALSVAAQFSLKAGMSGEDVRALMAQPLTARSALSVLVNNYVVVGFLLYGVGAIVWLAVLSKWDVSKAYPLVGLGFAVTVAIGWALGEHVTIARAVGVALICAGVFMVGQS
jgi:multidrug transporter EmrE-like cation transporter